MYSCLNSGLAVLQCIVDYRIEVSYGCFSKILKFKILFLMLTIITIAFCINELILCVFQVSCGLDTVMGIFIF